MWYAGDRRARGIRFDRAPWNGRGMNKIRHRLQSVWSDSIISEVDRVVIFRSVLLPACLPACLSVQGVRRLGALRWRQLGPPIRSWLYVSWYGVTCQRIGVWNMILGLAEVTQRRWPSGSEHPRWLECHMPEDHTLITPVWKLQTPSWSCLLRFICWIFWLQCEWKCRQTVKYSRCRTGCS